jgi:protein required for attachment to host cells
MKVLSTDLVALLDGQRLVLARNVAGNGDISLAIVESIATKNPPSHTLGRDRPGRTLDGAGDRRTGYAQIDPHEANEARFIEEAVDTIGQRYKQGGYSRVILAAAPKALGILRTRLAQSSGAFPVIEVSKNYTKTPIAEVSRLLADQN